MGQRITIQYSVDLEDLESEVGKMIKHASQKLEECGEDLGHTVGMSSAGTNLTLRMLGELTGMRERIGKIDYALIDISNIISSYVQYKSQPPQQPEAQSSELSESDLEAAKEKLQQIPKVEQLQEAIENFKQMTAAEDEVSD
tara:strand:- start:1032 stop:1457 length:426 start_codon:yes stop_codon:yes gene_type:complete